MFSAKIFSNLAKSSLSLLILFLHFFAYLINGKVIQNIGLYNMPHHPLNVADLLVGSITICIQLAKILGGRLKKQSEGSESSAEIDSDINKAQEQPRKDVTLVSTQDDSEFYSRYFSIQLFPNVNTVLSL